jgi:hypothetical protein
LLLFADAVRPYKDGGFVAIFPKCRCSLDSGQDTTICGKLVSLEMRIDEHLTPLAEVFQRIGLYVGMCLLQMVEVALLIRLPLLFEDLDILMGFPFVGAEEQEVGFPRTLGIGDNDICRDGGLHVTPPVLLLRDGRFAMFDAVMGWG